MPLWIIIGGNSSGKSAWGEEFIANTLGYSNVDYIATLDDSFPDPEGSLFRQKIINHQTRRPAGWKVWKEPFNPMGRILALPPHHGALWDGVGPYIATMMSRPDSGQGVSAGHSYAQAGSGPPMDRMMEEWRHDLMRIGERPGDTVVVTEETGFSILPVDPPTQYFVQALGQFNQLAAALATGVIMVVAGLPMWFKGEAR